jgi:hypothetical protein
MRSRFVLVLGLTGAMMGACSSAEPGQKAQSSSTAQTGASNSLASAPNSNTQVLANGAVVAPQLADANTAPAASGDAVTPPIQGRLEKMRSAGTSGEGADAAAMAIRNAQPAPDNSTFATYLTDAGYEIRTFKNNPVILKVEKRIENNGDQSLKVFLRNGNVVQLPGNAISPLSNASADAIASAAGVTTASPKSPAAGSTGAKKPGN